MIKTGIRDYRAKSEKRERYASYKRETKLLAKCLIQAHYVKAVPKEYTRISCVSNMLINEVHSIISDSNLDLPVRQPEEIIFCYCMCRIAKSNAITTDLTCEICTSPILVGQYYLVYPKCHHAAHLYCQITSLRGDKSYSSCSNCLEDPRNQFCMDYLYPGDPLHIIALQMLADEHRRYLSEDLLF